MQVTVPSLAVKSKWCGVAVKGLTLCACDNKPCVEVKVLTLCASDGEPGVAAGVAAVPFYSNL